MDKQSSPNMDSSLLNPVEDTRLQMEIMSQLWPCPSIGKVYQSDLDLGAYFTYYCYQSRMLNKTLLSTHAELAQAAQLLKTSSGKEVFKKALLTFHKASKEPKEHVLENTAILVIRQFVMMEIGQSLTCFSGRRVCEWNGGSLKSFIETQFPDPTLPYEGMRLDPSFNARNMERTAKFHIVWTSNMLDHLRVWTHENGSTCVAIFHYASFLQSYRGYVLCACVQ
jgi:hypothetical protein